MGGNVMGLYFYRLGSVKCEGFVYIYTRLQGQECGAGVWMMGGNVRGLYFYRLGSVKCEGFVYIYTRLQGQ